MCRLLEVPDGGCTILLGVRWSAPSSPEIHTILTRTIDQSSDFARSLFYPGLGLYALPAKPTQIGFSSPGEFLAD